MKVIIPDRMIHSHRGEPVEVGNVYATNRNPAFSYFRVVVGIANRLRGTKTIWNQVCCLHVDANGDVQGCSQQTQAYVSNHWDLIGKVDDMPTLKIRWLPEVLGETVGA